MKFEKMHGLGNDFIVLDRRNTQIDLPPALLARLADRQRGIGCDQVLVLDRPGDPAAAALLRIYNRDGSEAEACGNGTRCVAAKLLAETGQASVMIETIAGLRFASRAAGGQVQVDMGLAQLEWQAIPLAVATDTLYVPLAVPGFVGAAVCTNMGNPHATFFLDEIAAIDLPRIGPLLECQPIFPQRANIGFAQIIDRTRLRFRVWERGSGETLACGSGACGAVVGASRRGLTERRVTVELQHGELLIEWLASGRVLMTGPVAYVFAGDFKTSDAASATKPCRRQ